jgi:hypothetical protein
MPRPYLFANDDDAVDVIRHDGDSSIDTVAKCSGIAFQQSHATNPAADR